MSFNRLGTLFHKLHGSAAFLQPRLRANSQRIYLVALHFPKYPQQLEKRPFLPSNVQSGLPAGSYAMSTQSCANRLQETLRSFRVPSDAAPCDVTICIRGTEKTAEIFEAHMLVLGLFSERFRDMCSLERTKPDGPKSIFRFTGVEPHAFAIMLRYMYADDTSELTMENAMDLLLCANLFKAGRLIRICQDFIEIGLTVENACHIFQRACLVSEERLAQLALSVICKSPDRAFLSAEFLQLTPSVLKAILVRDDLNMPEDVIYQHIRRWALSRMCRSDNNGKENPSLRDVIGELRFAIRFPLFARDLVDSGPITDGVITVQELDDAASPVTDPSPFITVPRRPVPAPFYISCQIGVDAFGKDHPDNLTDRVVIELRPEFAPQACAYTQKLVELAKCDSLRPYCNVRLVLCDGFFIDCRHSNVTLQPSESLAQEISILSRTVPGAVCFGWEGNHCILDRARGFKPSSGEPEYGIWLASEKPDGGAVFGRIVHGLELLQSAYGHFLAGDVAAGGISYSTRNWCLHNSFPAKLRGAYKGMEVNDDMENERAQQQWTPSKKKEFRESMLKHSARTKIAFPADPQKL